MHTKEVVSHESGEQHCCVAEQSAPKVLGSVHWSPPPPVAGGEGAAIGGLLTGAGGLESSS